MGLKTLRDTADAIQLRNYIRSMLDNNSGIGKNEIKILETQLRKLEQDILESFKYLTTEILPTKDPDLQGQINLDGSLDFNMDKIKVSMGLQPQAGLIDQAKVGELKTLFEQSVVPVPEPEKNTKKKQAKGSFRRASDK